MINANYNNTMAGKLKLCN